MRTRVFVSLAGATLALAGCSHPPDPVVVGEKARAALQQQLDTNHPDDHLAVEKIDVVATTAPKYDGIALIKTNGSTFSLPVAVTSDGRTALVSADDERIAQGWHMTLLKRLSVLDSKYSDYVLSPDIMALFPASLTAAKKDFAARLQVVVPIKHDARWYFGSGCIPHDCTGDEAAWVIDRSTGKGAAIIMSEWQDDQQTFHHSFRLFGTSLNNMPAPLAQWGAQYDMNFANVSDDVPEYVPPAKK